MKATINGIPVEGTPEEIMKYEELMANKNTSLKPMKHTLYPLKQTLYPLWVETMNTHTASGKKICHNESCFCTGNCQRSSGS